MTLFIDTATELHVSNWNCDNYIVNKNNLYNFIYKN